MFSKALLLLVVVWHCMPNHKSTSFWLILNLKCVATTCVSAKRTKKTLNNQVTMKTR